MASTEVLESETVVKEARANEFNERIYSDGATVWHDDQWAPIEHVAIAARAMHENPELDEVKVGDFTMRRDHDTNKDDAIVIFGRYTDAGNIVELIELFD